ncbi:MAG: antibiotic biosynthesis monooxygenase [Caulobacteraceae bacterium]|nr:antibiotic biosynthesis monooxygenase [Caulobacteraceae bacterium]
MVAILKSRPGKAEALLALLEATARASRLEPGNRAWEIWRSVSDADTFVLNELYVDQAALEAHRASPHFQAYVKAIGDLADRTAVIVEPINLG